MNKTITINLAKINFYIDEKAFEQLDIYLKAISGSLTPGSRKETMQDIESRIAELFIERNKTKEQVVTEEDVNYVIQIMGEPKDYQLEEDEEEPTDPPVYQADKKLYRDPDSGIIAGVCAGLAYYFGIPKLWVRILFIILVVASFTSMGIVYIILWIFIPAARTTREKLEMRGEKINIDNIEKEVREGFQNLKRNVKQTYSDSGNFRNGLERFLIALGNLIAKFVGVILVIIGFSVLLSLFLSIIGLGGATFADTNWLDYVRAADIGIPFSLAVILIVAFLAIPFFYVLWAGLKLLSKNLRNLNKITNRSLFGIWVISFLAVVFLAVRQAPLRAYDRTSAHTENIDVSLQDTLRIQTDGRKKDYNMGSFNDLSIVKNENNDQKYIVSNQIRLQIRPTHSSPYLEIIKSAKGKNPEAATKNAERIVYPIKMKGHTLILGEVFKTEIQHKFNQQKVTVNIYLPENQLFALDKDLSFLGNIHYRNQGKILIMENENVVCLDCKEME